MTCNCYIRTIKASNNEDYFTFRENTDFFCVEKKKKFEFI